MGEGDRCNRAIRPADSSAPAIVFFVQVTYWVADFSEQSFTAARRNDLADERDCPIWPNFIGLLGTR